MSQPESSIAARPIVVPRQAGADGPPAPSLASARDDAALVQASQQGDRDAFGVLVSRHAASVLGVTRRMLGAEADAEDVAQETFVAAFRALGGFKQDAKFSTWVYRIAVNKCTDHLRARKPSTVSLDASDAEGTQAMEAVQDTTTPHVELEQVEMGRAIERALQALPSYYRESFVLRHVDGLEYGEMSEILGVHRDTLKMRVYKARLLLGESLRHLSGAHR